MLRFAAFVSGRPEHEEFTIDTGLLKKRFEPWKMAVSRSRGRRSLSQFRTIETFTETSYLHCMPLTQRRHQLRAHLHSFRMPIIGDRTYHGKELYLSSLKPGYRQKRNQEEQPLIPRLALHAERLLFAHPVSGNEIEVLSPLPKYFNVALKYLRRYSPTADS